MPTKRYDEMSDIEHVLLVGAPVKVTTKFHDDDEGSESSVCGTLNVIIDSAGKVTFEMKATTGSSVAPFISFFEEQKYAEVTY